MKENNSKNKKKLKVCLYLQNSKFYDGSGIGKAINHQKKALELNNIEYTTNPNDSDYQILHINSQLPGALKIIKKAKKDGKKIVIHAHMTSEDFKGSIFLSNFMARFIRIWLNFFYNKADLIICPSSYTRDILKKYPQLKDKEIAVVSNGIDLDEWAYDLRRAEKFKQDYNLNKPIVFAVGLVFPRKGIVDFIKTAKRIPNADFLWAGKYLKKFVRNRELERELQKKSQNMHLAGFVEDIIGAYSAGDIFFFPSKEENEGIVILQAAAMKKAIVVRDIPVFRSYLKDRVNCLMAKTDDEFVDKINLLLKDAKLRKKLAVNARKLAESKSLKKIGKELRIIYEGLL